MGRLESSETGSNGIGSAIVLTIVLTMIMGGTFHYTLKRHNEEQVTQLTRQAQAAGEQEAVAVSRVFSSLGGGLVQTDLFRIQDMLASGFSREGLVDAVVIDPDNMIVAAKDQTQIGKQVQEIAWLSSRAQNKEIVTRAQDQAGRVFITVIEPLKEKDETIAWAKLTYVISQPAQTLRSSSARLKETAKLVGPLAVMLFIGVFVLMRFAEAKIRKQNQPAASSGQGGESGVSPGQRLRKVG
jgi:uncharacterized membrane protein affecting hemolysin expression